MNPSALERRRKLRLMQMVEIARVYRGCSKHELASMLDRDPAKIVPESGNPKLDLVVGLAEALSWSVADVVDAIWGLEPPVEPPAESFDELDRLSKAAHRDGDYARMLLIGRQMHSVAAQPRERALAALRITGAYDGTGHYVRALEWIQAATREPDLPAHARRLLQANLAGCHASVGNLVEAQSIADCVIRELAEGMTTERADRSAEVIAWYVLGSARRRMLAQDPARRMWLAERAGEALQRAESLAARMSQEFDDIAYAGIANTCRGGLIESRVAAGSLGAEHALKQILGELAEITDVAGHPKGDLLESWGWWAIFGANIAHRHLDGEARDRWLAVLTNKASEIAERQGNWCMREQIFTMEYIQRAESAVTAGGATPNWVLDVDDLRNLVGAMGRFPHFRSTGWRILSTASVVGLQGGVT